MLNFWELARFSSFSIENDWIWDVFYKPKTSHQFYFFLSQCIFQLHKFLWNWKMAEIFIKISFFFEKSTPARPQNLLFLFLKSILIICSCFSILNLSNILCQIQYFILFLTFLFIIVNPIVIFSIEFSNKNTYFYYYFIKHFITLVKIYILLYQFYI